MSPSWLDQLEQGLEERLAAFLRANPYQELLLRQQHQQDRYSRLQGQRQQLQQEAEEQRRQLLNVADTVQEWSERIKRAKAAGASNLADRAQQHVNNLMEQGRQLWAELEQLGTRFQVVERQLDELSHEAKSSSHSLEDDWEEFEAQQSLETLKRERAQEK